MGKGWLGPFKNNPKRRCSLITARCILPSNALSRAGGFAPSGGPQTTTGGPGFKNGRRGDESNPPARHNSGVGWRLPSAVFAVPRKRDDMGGWAKGSQGGFNQEIRAHILL